MTVDTTKYGGNEFINLKVLGQNNAAVQFKIKWTTPFRKLMNAYCDRAGLPLQVVVFRYIGRIINEEDTPAKLNMQNYDTIEVYMR